MIFLFLVIHLRSFFIPSRFGAEKVGAYELVMQAFANPWYDAFYLFALFLLGYHLRHGFQSAFQTLGLRNKKYMPFLDWLAFIAWFLIPVGFAAIPIYCYFYQQAASTVLMGVH
jgi:succinate dehydrogenase / fumarate reductase cytochrome b subunit